MDMSSQLGLYLRNEMITRGLYNDNNRRILMLVDPTQTLGKKYHARNDEYQDVYLANMQSLPPYRVEPKLSEETIYTYVGNRDHRMACGFIAKKINGRKLKINWQKDGL